MTKPQLAEIDLNQEFDRQVARLVELGYPRDPRIGELRAPFAAAGAGDFPPVIVIPRPLAAPEQLVSLVDRSDGAPGTVIGAEAMGEYRAIDDLELPVEQPYLICGIDTGWDTRNDRPQDALIKIAAAGRTPLTIEEGLALHTHFPNVIAPNEGFSLAGSTRGDRRVPALWISKKRPKLGWCFMGAPHTWLGTASCAMRISS